MWEREHRWEERTLGWDRTETQKRFCSESSLRRHATRSELHMRGDHAQNRAPPIEGVHLRGSHWTFQSRCMFHRGNAQQQCHAFALSMCMRGLSPSLSLSLSHSGAKCVVSLPIYLSLSCGSLPPSPFPYSYYSSLSLSPSLVLTLSLSLFSGGDYVKQLWGPQDLKPHAPHHWRKLVTRCLIDEPSLVELDGINELAMVAQLASNKTK